MKRREFLFLATASLLAGCASQDNAPGAGDSSGMKFTESERSVIEAFYGKASGPLPPQRAKVGDVLDPGQRPAPLPSNLSAKLPYPQGPYTRYILGNDVILVNRDTHQILDVIPQIVR